MLTRGIIDRRLIEDKMRCIRRNEPKVRPSTNQQLHCGGKVIGQIVEMSSVKHRDSPINIEAVDDDVDIPHAACERGNAVQDA
jgi:hypothetical protein